MTRLFLERQRCAEINDNETRTKMKINQQKLQQQQKAPTTGFLFKKNWEKGRKKRETRDF